MSNAPQHFLDLADFNQKALRDLLDAAHARKKARDKNLPKAAPDADAPLQGHILAMLFDQPSTRTRVSFDMAMRQLGGQVLMLNSDEMQLGRGEEVADTARVLSRYVDALMVRTVAHEDIVTLAAHASVPVINGLTAFSHPCQIIADIMTFEEHCGAIKGRKIAWLGDGNNVAVSWIHAAAVLGFELHLATPDMFAPPQTVVDWAVAQGAKLTVGHNAKEAAKGAAAVVTDCWVSMSDDPDTAAKRAASFKPYQVTEEIMALSDDAVFLHCLPAYRGREVAAAVIDGARSVVLDEAENRTHAQKAILHFCLASP